jgi:ribulose-5-phosphate 4-epimerase/fuculose-1-phosphate aldolase
METDDIQRQRVELAAAFRWAARLGFHEGVCNHFSVAISDSGDSFLVNPHGMHFSRIRASDLLLVEPDGSVTGGGEAPEPTAFFIHSRLHRGVPQARCILHCHMPYATALTTLEGGRLEPVNQNGLRFFERIAYDDDYNGLALDDGEGDRICAALGNHQVMFMANHGVTVTGHSVAFAFDTMYYLERACQNQVLAMSTGRPLKRVPDDMARKVAQQIAQEDNSGRHFAELMRILDREEPDYAS